MKVVVNINYHTVSVTHVSMAEAFNIAERLERYFQVQRLKDSGIKAEVYVDRVPSKMNDINFSSSDFILQAIENQHPVSTGSF